MNSLSSRPYKSLDAWRGIAALAVVFHHVSSVVVGKWPDQTANPLYHIEDLGYLGVQLFFVISGLCIASAAVSSLKHPDCVKRFAVARLRRVFPALWISLLIIGIVSLTMTMLAKTGHIHGSTLANIDLLHKPITYFVANITLTNILLHQPYISIVCWTLSYELSFYLIVALMMAIPAVRRDPEKLMFGTNLSTAACLLLLIAAPNLRVFPFDLWPEFGLGMLVYQSIQPQRSRANGLWIALIAGEFLAFVALRSVPMSVAAEPSRLTFSVCLLFAALLVGLHRFDDKLIAHPVVKGLSDVGLFSYSLYLTHFTVLGFVNQFSRGIHLKENMHIAFGLAAVVVSVVCAWIFHILFEKPFMRTRRPAPTPEVAEIKENPAPAPAMALASSDHAG